MPYTEEDLGRALINADKAGDVDSARQLAAEIRRMRSEMAVTTQPEARSAGMQALRDVEFASRGFTDSASEALGAIPDYVGQGMRAVGLPAPEDPRFYSNKLKQGVSALGKAISPTIDNFGPNSPEGGQEKFAYGAGRGAADAATFALPAAAVAKGARAGSVTQGAAQTLAAQPVAQTLAGAVGGGVGESTDNPLLGMAASVATPLLTKGGARVVKPNTDPAVRLLLDEGVTPTPGQILGGAWNKTEQKAMSVPGLGDAIAAGRTRAVDDLNRAAYNRALGPIGQNADNLPLGRDGVDEVASRLGAAYDDVLPRLSLVPDQQFSDKIGDITAATATLPDAQQRQFSAIIDQVVTRGLSTGRSIKDIEGDLGKMASNNMASSTAAERSLGESLGDVQKAMREALIRTSSPDDAARLQDIDRGYANYARIRNAGARAGAEDRFSPAQLDGAVRATDKSVSKGNVARGNALMQDLSDAGRKVLGNNVPDSGTPARMLLAGLGMGGGAMVNPLIPLGAAAAAVPYTAPVQKLAAALLAKRPDFINNAAIEGPDVNKALLATILAGRDKDYSLKPR